MAEAVAAGSGSTSNSQQQSQAPQQQQKAVPSKQSQQDQSAIKNNPIRAAAKEVQGAADSDRTVGDEVEGEFSEGVSEDTSEVPPEAGETETPEDDDRDLSEIDFSDEKLKFKIKIKGKDVTVNGAQAKKLIEQGGRMYVAMEEAAGLRKQVGEWKGLVEQIKSSPDNFLEFAEAIGVNFDQIAHDYVHEKVKYHMMDEKDRKIYDYEKRDKLRAKQEQESKKQSEEQQRQQVREQRHQAVTNEVMEFYGDRRPKQQELVDVLTVCQESLTQSGKRLPVAKAYEIVQNRYKAQRSELLKTLKLDELPTHLREEVRQSYVKQARTPRQSAPAERMQNQTKASPQKPKSQTFEEYFAKLDDKYK